MIIELANRLLKAYPEIFQEFGKRQIPEESKHHYDFSVGNGWYHLIQDMCYHIEEIKKDANPTVKVVCIQLKEKFSGLRFYHTVTVCPRGWASKMFLSINTWLKIKICKWGYSKIYWKFDDWRKEHIYITYTERIDDLIAKKERESYKTCERCGEPGKLSNIGHWMLTLCEKHHQTDEKKSNEEGE